MLPDDGSAKPLDIDTARSTTKNLVRQFVRLYLMFFVCPSVRISCYVISQSWIPPYVDLIFDKVEPD